MLKPLVRRYKQIFSEFEPQGWRDWALIPWWALRYAFAWCWWRLAILKVRIRRQPWYYALRGRHDDPTPIFCPRCLWAGPYRWLAHTYVACGEEDVEPASECPRCGNLL